MRRVPIYEYRCGRCELVFDRLVRAGDSAPRCPACGAEEAQRLVSRIASLPIGDAACAPGGT